MRFRLIAMRTRAAEDDSPIKFMLEEQIMIEQNDVWEIEKYLGQQRVKLEGAKGKQKTG